MAIGEFSDAPATLVEWRASVSVMQEVAGPASGAGVSLSFERLNRFEIYLLNCVADTDRYVREIGCDNVGVHDDSFREYMKEKDSAGAIDYEYGLKIEACGSALATLAAATKI